MRYEVICPVRAATPGRILPSRNSREAPPPVEIWVILEATPDCWTAATESPPPTMVVALALLATAWAMALVPLAKAGISKTPIGPFQMMVLASAISLEKSAMDLGPMSRAMRSAGKEPCLSKRVVLASGANLSARMWSMGRRKRTPFFAALARAALATSVLSVSTRGFSGGLALCVEEGVGHASADDDGVGFGEKVIDDHYFVGDFGSADDGDEGLDGVGNCLAEIGELFVHEEAGGGLFDEVGDAFRGGVGAVGAAEGVVDIDVAEAGELFGEDGIVGLFFGMEAEVFEQEGLAGFKIVGHLGGDLTYAVGREGYVLVLVDDVIEEETEAVDDGAKTHALDDLTLGSAEMGAENDPRFAAECVLDGGNGLADASVVGDDAVLERDVEVDANEDALVFEIEIANR